MTIDPKLEALYDRMAAQQRALLLQAANAGVIPSAGALAQIASLEHALSAVDALLEEHAPPLAPMPAPKRADSAADRPPQLAPPQAPAKTSRIFGFVKWFDPTKCFGFIVPDDGSPDVFVRSSTVTRAGMSELFEGQPVSFEIRPDRRTGKPAADQLEAVEWAEA